jgi:hypothetical protein
MICFAEWTIETWDTYSICKADDPSGRYIQFEIDLCHCQEAILYFVEPRR